MMWEFVFATVQNKKIKWATEENKKISPGD